MSLTQNAEVETGVVSRDNIDAVGQHISAESANNLSPRRQANVAVLQHSSVVGEVLTRIERAHHFFGVGEIFLDQPVTLKHNIAAFVCDGIAYVINVTLRPTVSVSSTRMVLLKSCREPFVNVG